MTRHATRRRLQKAVLWPAVDTGAASDHDGYGEHKVDISERVELDVRWEEVQREAIDPKYGNTIAINAVVVVDRDIPVGSIMWLGEEDDLPDAVASYTKLKEVVICSKIPDIKGRTFRRVVSLRRYSRELPVTA